MDFSVGFAKGAMEFNIDDNNIQQVLSPNKVLVNFKGEEEVKRALKTPINSERLKDIVSKGENIVIVTSDITRPMPSRKVLPSVIEELNSGGVSDNNITIIFALGSHRKHTEEEKKYLVGEAIFNRINCIDSDDNNYVYLGETRNGTPVEIFKPVVEGDRVILLGNIEYHYFAGYSGGLKAIMPGVSTKSAIQANHKRMVEEEAKAGNINTNPVRLDIEEAAALVKVDYIVNVVLDEKKEIVKTVCGHPIDAHREGCKFLDSLYKIQIDKKADIVITSPGGYPKDLNLYQAQKALDNAKHAVKENGIIIFVASCIEGFGSSVFEEWLLRAEKSEELISWIHKEFKLGGHKGAAIAMVLQKSKIYFVSEMEEAVVKNIFMEPYENVQKALEQAFRELGTDAKVVVMPYGGSTLPVVSNNG
ncbi:nickel-dependent malate racemase, LarAH6 family [Clostridium sp. DL1XJH146]